MIGEVIVEENKLPEVFDSFNDARKQGFITVKELKDNGKKVVGTFCTYTPVEVFMAAGAVYVGLCSTSDETIPEAEKVLPRNLCPLIKSSYGFAITDKCPYMYFSDLVVGETTCDGKKKMYELLGEIKNVYVMQLPQTQITKEAQEMWYQEILKLKDRVEQDLQVTISNQDLEQAIKDKNHERRVMKEFYELSTLCPPPMSGLEQLQVLFGAQFKFDLNVKINEIVDLTKQLKAEYESGVRKISAEAKRILITGCPMGGVTDKIVRIIEEVGGVVVAYENCTGVKQMDLLVAEDSVDPCRAIAERYLEIGCSIMTPNNNRYELLERLAKQFQVDGVIEMTLQACHTYNIETHSVRKFLEEKDIPFLSVETDYSTSDIAQLKTRIGAFIEMIS